MSGPAPPVATAGRRLAERAAIDLFACSGGPRRALARGGQPAVVDEIGLEGPRRFFVTLRRPSGTK